MRKWDPYFILLISPHKLTSIFVTKIRKPGDINESAGVSDGGQQELCAGVPCPPVGPFLSPRMVELQRRAGVT